MVSENLLDFAAGSYSFDRSMLEFISDSTNKIYSLTKDDKSYILRFSERPAEDIHRVKAEMDWLYYLANNGVRVSLPLQSNDNQLAVATEDDGKSYIISVFETLHGKFFNTNDPDLWNTEIFFNWGQLMGELHRLTKAYSPANQRDMRAMFNGYNALDINNMKDSVALCQLAEKFVAEIMALPKDEDSYGLIHYDIHPGNFVIDNGQLSVFDFDDSLYGWFAMDIGIALYHGLWWGRINESGQDFTNDIIKHFLLGYQSANSLSDFWLAKIPLFMNYRQLCKLSWFYNPDPNDKYQNEEIRNIENGILFNDCHIDASLFRNDVD